MLTKRAGESGIACNPTGLQSCRDERQRIKSCFTQSNAVNGSSLYVATVETGTVPGQWNQATKKTNTMKSETLENALNELESRRADSAQLERMVNLINAALPDFKSMMGNEADHAELALQALIAERAALVAVAETAEKAKHNLERMMALLAGYGYSCKGGKFPAETDELIHALAAVRGGKAMKS